MTGAEPKVTQELALAHGLTAEEYDRIIRRLDREPTFTELGLFSALWSEHCAYKHSRVFLRTLPTRGDHVLQGPGENAGIVNEEGTVLGLMPHPERAAESAMGGTDGLLLFHSLLGSLVEDGTFSKR